MHLGVKDETLFFFNGTLLTDQPAPREPSGAASSQPWLQPAGGDVGLVTTPVPFGSIKKLLRSALFDYATPVVVRKVL